MNNDWIFDLETYPHVFTAAFEHAEAPFTAEFEISPWRDDAAALVEFLYLLRDQGARLVGFNSLGFDLPILHMLIRAGKLPAEALYAKAMAIIGSQNNDDGEDRWVHQVYPKDRLLPQIDLFRVHHFDNRARSTSLKALQFVMRSESIEDLPFPVGTVLTQDQVPVLRKYGRHDVSETKKFYKQSLDMIRFREELCKKYPGPDWINFSDAKIGKQYFIMRLEQSGVDCYEYGPDGRRPRQTRRASVALKDAIPLWATFQHPEFNRVLSWLREQTVIETKGVFKDLTATINGFTFVFGLGGIHGSVENEAIISSETQIIESVDVSSMYPNIAIKNRYYPAHLGEKFCDIYEEMYEDRKKHKKGTNENATMKLGLNASFGDSGNPFSVFYDPLFLLRITIAGQMALCMLCERLMSIPTVRLLMINTDGCEYTVRPEYADAARTVCKEWERQTKLTLEYARYKRLFILNCNNYLGEYVDSSVKRKGCFDYERGFHQDHSALIIPKAAERALLYGESIRTVIENWPDISDLFLRIKVPKSGYLQYGDVQVQNTSRYLVTKNGKSLTKWLPPLKGKSEWRSFAVESGWLCTVCNRLSDAEGVVPDYDYYCQETEKLVLGMK